MSARDETQRVLRQDLSRKLQLSLGAVLERDLNIAHHVLDAHQCGLLLIEAAVMVVRTVGASVATVGEQTGKVDILYDATIDSVIMEVRASRNSAIRRITAELARRAAA